MANVVKNHTTHHLDFFFIVIQVVNESVSLNQAKKWKEEKMCVSWRRCFFLISIFWDSLTQRRLILEMLSFKKIPSISNMSRRCVSESSKKRRIEKTASPSRKGFFSNQEKSWFTDTSSATTENAIFQKKFLAFPIANESVSLKQAKKRRIRKIASPGETHFSNQSQKSRFTDTDSATTENTIFRNFW